MKGPGSTYGAALMADENLENPHGCGLTLMRVYMDEVTFNEKGNRVTMRKKAPGPDAERKSPADGGRRERTLRCAAEAGQIRRNREPSLEYPAPPRRPILSPRTAASAVSKRRRSSANCSRWWTRRAPRRSSWTSRHVPFVTSGCLGAYGRVQGGGPGDGGSVCLIGAQPLIRRILEVTKRPPLLSRSHSAGSAGREVDLPLSLGSFPPGSEKS